MPYFFAESDRWFSGALCCRYLVVRFDKLRLPMFKGRDAAASEWHWALGFFTNGQIGVIGAWQDDGAKTPERIADDLHKRGVERIGALAAETAIVGAMADLGPKACKGSATELLESGAFGPRMQRAIRWTDAAGRHLQARLDRVATRQVPFADRAASTDFIARAMQKAERDLLNDCWDRTCPASYGPGAFVASLAGNA
jgi:hypothetical protein